MLKTYELKRQRLKELIRNLYHIERDSKCH